MVPTQPAQPLHHQTPHEIPPSLCGSFLGSKRSFLAFMWTVTTLLTLLAFLTAVALTIKVNSHYRHLEKLYANNNYYNRQYNNYDRQRRRQQEDEIFSSPRHWTSDANEQRLVHLPQHHRIRYLQEEGEEGGEGDREGEEEHRDSHDEEEEEDEDNEEDNRARMYSLLASTSSGAMNFCALYTMCVAVALTLYGSMAIVGFTSLQGVYIAPCFSSSSKMTVGIFAGALMVFSSMLLLCAVVFGELRVEDYLDERMKEEQELPGYAVERIATILAVTCMFLSVLYSVFAVLLFVSYASSSSPPAYYHVSPSSPTRKGDGVHHDGVVGVSVNHHRRHHSHPHQAVGSSMIPTSHHHHHPGRPTQHPLVGIQMTETPGMHYYQQS